MQLGQQTSDQTEQVFLEMLRGPISIYFDTEEQFDKETMESQIE